MKGKLLNIEDLKALHVGSKVWIERINKAWLTSHSYNLGDQIYTKTITGGTRFKGQVGTDAIYIDGEAIKNGAVAFYDYKEEPTYKFKAGDKARVKSDLVAGEYYNNGCYFSYDMTKHRGTVIEIAGVRCVSSGQPRYSADTNRFSWTDDMLEPVEIVKVSESALKVLDVLKSHRELIGSIGLTSYSKSKYQVGTVFKKDDNFNTDALGSASYYVIVSVLGASTNSGAVSYYHGANIFFNKYTKQWDCGKRFTHLGPDCQGHSLQYASNDGAKFLEELFKTNPGKDLEKEKARQKVENIKKELANAEEAYKKLA